jgi:serine/threonine protein phosphatase PrpC
MNFDCDFQIGHDHAFMGCQDYALVGQDRNKKYAIICDGCSASPDVDIGARLLALSAKETIIASNNSDLKSDVTTYEGFGKACIHRADAVYGTFPALHPQALDATLLVVQVEDKRLKAFIYGDGVFFHKTAKGLFAAKIELSTGAPDYLSYNLDSERLNLYTRSNEERGGVKKLTAIRRFEDGGIDESELSPFAPVIFEREVSEGDIIAICSDGINSFRKSDDTPISWMGLSEEFIGYKNTTGVFVKRRLNAFKKKCAKEGITHADDISVASIIV